MGTSVEWEKDFPKGYGHTSIAYLKRCYGFDQAKNGDLSAAQFVVNKCTKKERICELRNTYPDAVLLPVLCRNKLPLALAQEIRLPICYSVLLKATISRKHLCAMQRLLHVPVFIGYIQKNVAYILVDDVITQGGTISALRKFVINNGGSVVAVVALSYAIGSHSIAPARKYVILFMIKFGGVLESIFQMIGSVSSVYELTNSQIKYLLRFSSIRNIEKKIRFYETMSG